MAGQKLTVETDIKTSPLSESLQKEYLAFCRFLSDNDFLIEAEADGNGWQFRYGDRCVGHMNFSIVDHANVPAGGVWIDVCDFGGSNAAENALKESTWAHVRMCEHFASGGAQCGCGNQPGSTMVLFGKTFENLCFAALEYISPAAKTLEDIKKLMLLFRQYGSAM